MIFYDFEVFKHDWLVCFLDSDTRDWTVIINDTEKLREFHKTHLNDIYVGFNSRHYDQYIYKGILAGFNPKEINDFIIEQGNGGWEFSRELFKYKLNNYDVRGNVDRGLKVFEGFMGVSIEESNVPFDIDRKLTEAEIAETVEYCKYDVEQTMAIFVHRFNDFKAQFDLLKEFDMPLNNISKTKVRLSAEILGAKARGARASRDEFDLRLPDTLRLEKPEYQAIADWYLDPKNHRYFTGKTKNQQNVSVAGVPHVFGFGGVHGAIDKYHGKGHYLMMDVASLYPSLMIEYDLMSRAVEDRSRFGEIKKRRFELKEQGDSRQEALKLVLNGTYGAMKDKTNPLFDPLAANLVCVYGQLLLLDLIEKLEPHCQIIQSNTDGILVKLHKASDYDLIDDIAHEWEQRTRLELEFEEYREVWQKDVNNYVIVEHDGGYKSKGAWVKKLSDLDYDLPIVNRALVEYMVNGDHPEVTVKRCEDLKDFQLVVNASYRYNGIVHGSKVLKERVARVFASKNKADGGVFKESKRTGRNEKMANSPAHCFIWNDVIDGVKVPKQLDRQFYVDMAVKRIKDFGGII